MPNIEWRSLRATASPERKVETAIENQESKNLYSISQQLVIKEYWINTSKKLWRAIYN